MSQTLPLLARFSVSRVGARRPVVGATTHTNLTRTHAPYATSGRPHGTSGIHTGVMMARGLSGQQRKEERGKVTEEAEVEEG